eukprot:SM000003S11231  [mRNA]  locus=s3:1599960:1600769:+ [translate_table: standard]
MQPPPARPPGRKRKARWGRQSALDPAAARDHGSLRPSKVLKMQELGEKRQLTVDEAKKLPQKLWEEVKQDLDQRAAQGETVVEGGTGGKSLEAQIHLAEGKPVRILPSYSYLFSLLGGFSVLAKERAG